MAKRCRFVTPKVVRLPLSDGDWIEVKERLTVGEERDAFQQVVGEVSPEGWRRPNVAMLGVAEIVAYLVDWSLRDALDKPVAVNLDAVRSLDKDTFKEIEQAVTAHIEAMDAAEVARKNGQGGESGSAPTSPSVIA